jgi:hypothetical protein
MIHEITRNGHEPESGGGVSCASWIVFYVVVAMVRDWPQFAYAESVRQFQPRVALWLPWDQQVLCEDANPEGVTSGPQHRNRRNSFRVAMK